MEIGFLGMGIIPKAMAINLLRKGFKVTVSRTLFPSVELEEHGASVSESPAAVIKKCKYTIGMFSDLPTALFTVFYEEGVLEGIGSGKSYIDMSTFDAHTSSKMSEAITDEGGRFLEAPFSGSMNPAEDGQLVILAAGDKALYDEILPAFNVLGKKSFFLGPVGNGANMKLVANMIMGSMMCALSEGLVLADRSGLNPHALPDAMELSSVANPMFKMKGPKMLESKYNRGFPLKHMQNDMRQAIALGDEKGVTLPVAAAANEGLKKAIDLGLEDLDFSAVFLGIKGGRPTYDEDWSIFAALKIILMRN